MFGNNILKNTSNAILTILLCFCFITSISYSLKSEISNIFLLAIIFILMLIFLSIYLYTKSFKIYSISYFIMSLLTVSLIFLYHKDNFINWINNLIVGIRIDNQTYKMLFIFLMILVIFYLVMYFTVIRFNFFIVLFSGISMFVIQVTNDIIINYMSFYIYIFLIIIFYFKHIHFNKKNYNNNEYTNSNTFSFFVMPISVLILIIIYFMPVNEKPADIKLLDFFDKAIYNTFIKKDAFGTDLFSLDFSGFGNSKKLGGDVDLNNRKVLEVDSDSRIYLKGAVHDIYDGKQWNKINDDVKSIYNETYTNLDVEETNNGISLYSDNVEDYYKKYTVNIKYNLNTRSIFVPIKTSKINIDEQILFNPNDTFFAPKLLKRGYEYSVDTYVYSYREEAFQNILRNSKPGFYKESNVDLYENAKEINKKYTQIPESLPIRVKVKALEITENEKSTYDKAKAIERFLVSNYSYTLTPGEVPSNRDFVDYFIFDTKEGYCVYFATSMAVMCRTIGIPTRYVIGYVLPPQKEKNGLYYVTNQQAHAWVEVYLEGFGWIPFEATSGYSGNFYNNPSYAGKYSNDFLTNPDYEEYLEGLQGLGSNDPFGLDGMEGNQNNANQISKVKIVLVIVGTVIIMLLSIFLINIFRKKFKYMEFKKLENEKSILKVYTYYLKIFKTIGYTINPGETPLQYSIRIDRFFRFNKKNNFKTITDIFVYVRYSNNKVSANQKNTVLNFEKTLLYFVKNKRSKFRYYIERYLLGIY